jgi:hypothetical protein
MTQGIQMMRTDFDELIADVIVMTINAARAAGMRPNSVEVRPDGVVKVCELESAGPLAPADEFMKWELAQQ